jgi:hypothetical protein
MKIPSKVCLPPKELRNGYPPDLFGPWGIYVSREESGEKVSRGPYLQVGYIIETTVCPVSGIVDKLVSWAHYQLFFKRRLQRGILVEDTVKVRCDVRRRDGIDLQYPQVMFNGFTQFPIVPCCKFE